MEKIKEFAEKLFTVVSSHRELVLGLAVVALILIASIILYANHKKSTETVPVIYTTYSAPDTPLAPYAVLDAANANNRQVSNNDASDIARFVNRSVSTEKAFVHSITTDEAVADNQAKEIAKDSKADMVIKKTSEDRHASNEEMAVQDNNYYIVNQERKHSVAVGVADVDSEAYVTASYRNRKTEVTGYYNPSTGKTGAGISYEVARW